jgi:hypothetical protein
MNNLREKVEKVLDDAIDYSYVIPRLRTGLVDELLAVLKADHAVAVERPEPQPLQTGRDSAGERAELTCPCANCHELVPLVRVETGFAGEVEYLCWKCMVITFDKQTGSTHMADHEQWGELMAEKLNRALATADSATRPPAQSGLPQKVANGPYCYRCGERLVKQPERNGVQWMGCNSCGLNAETSEFSG